MSRSLIWKLRVVKTRLLVLSIVVDAVFDVLDNAATSNTLTCILRIIPTRTSREDALDCAKGS